MWGARECTPRCLWKVHQGLFEWFDGERVSCTRKRSMTKSVQLQSESPRHPSLSSARTSNEAEPIEN